MIGRLSRCCALVAGAVSCSLLVASDPEPVRCSQEGYAGPPACDVGQSCQRGICQPATSAPAPAGGAGAGGEAGAGG